MEAILNEPNSQWFTKVFHYIIRLEYQQRGTIHFHIAIWCIPKHLPSHYKGRTGATMADRVRRGHQDTSPFHAYLENLFSCHVEVQWTTARLNCINGYTTCIHAYMHPCIQSPMHRHMYTATYLTVCYGWRVGIVQPNVIMTATAAPNCDLTYLMPYLTYLTPYLTCLTYLRPAPYV